MEKIKKVQNYGIKRCTLGTIKTVRNCFFRLLYGYNAWHDRAIEFRPCEHDLRNKLCLMQNSGDIPSGLVMEIGVGLGEILGYKGLMGGTKIGVDYSKEVLKAAKFLHGEIEFIYGTMDVIDNYEIDLLIMVGFLHRISDDDLKNSFYHFFERNTVKVIAFDVVENIEKSNYQYSHDGNKLLSDFGFKRLFRSDGYDVEGSAVKYFEIYSVDKG